MSYIALLSALARDANQLRDARITSVLVLLPCTTSLCQVHYVYDILGECALNSRPDTPHKCFASLS